MKFLADMGISPRTVEFLRSLKHEAVHLSEEGLERLPDTAILEKARRDRQVLLTSDLDFAELVAASEAKLPSVITFFACGVCVPPMSTVICRNSSITTWMPWMKVPSSALRKGASEYDLCQLR